MLTERDHFNVFFHEHLEAIYRFARRFAGDHDIARDIAQDAFIRLYERRGAFASGEQARSFLYITARNACLDYMKHKKIEQQYRDAPREEYQDREQTFLDEVTYQETCRCLHAAIEKLPPRGRAVILHGMEGKNNLEIAGAMQVSVNTVKSLKKAAYAALRTFLGDALAWFL
jgi:RNA polymerase sigma-70 factor (ECF subfamily)